MRKVDNLAMTIIVLEAIRDNGVDDLFKAMSTYPYPFSVEQVWETAMVNHILDDAKKYDLQKLKASCYTPGHRPWIDNLFQIFKDDPDGIPAVRHVLYQAMQCGHITEEHIPHYVTEFETFREIEHKNYVLTMEDLEDQVGLKTCHEALKGDILKLKLRVLRPDRSIAYIKGVTVNSKVITLNIT